MTTQQAPTRPALTAIETELLDRLMAKVEKQPDGCWIFTGQLNPKGYGQIIDRSCAVRDPARRDVRTPAHRVAYTLLVAPIPEGLVIDHVCRVHACVNPAHLEAVSNRENILRGLAPAAVNARKRWCRHGHELTPDNLYMIRSRWGRARSCRECQRIKRRRPRELATTGIPGHTIVQAGAGDWRCKCGLPLALGQSAAREAMALHRRELMTPVGATTQGDLSRSETHE